MSSSLALLFVAARCRRPLARPGSLAAAGLAVMLALAAAAPAAEAATRGPGASRPAAGFKGSSFYSVSSVSATRAWAVGALQSTKSDTVLTVTARWNGTGWTQVASPSPGGSNAVSELTGVSALTASDAWAVGSYGTFGAATLALHWNGTSWTQVPTPNPGFPSAPNDLTAVSAASASDAWAVGYYGNLYFRTLALHWNGTSWAQVATPDPAGSKAANQLLGVSATSASSAWAVGCYGSNDVKQGPQKTLVLGWNGSAWTQAPTPNPGASGCLTAVAAVSPSDAWAVGWTEATLSGPERTLVLHWNGSRWSQVASPSVAAGSSSLAGVSAASANCVWAVGNVAASAASTTTLVLHWNGIEWARMASPNDGSSALDGVNAVSASDALAVGTSGTGSLALRWNGTKWVVA
jgi:hypothetical protein